MKTVWIYTDGACRGNPGLGGWGAYLIYGAQEKKIWGGEEQTTNNRMEMTAAIEALKALNQPCDVKLYTDSRYLQQGITEWMIKWKARNWQSANKKPIKNQDLWRELDRLINYHNVEWHWVKGHSDNEGNELADQLANQGADEVGQQKV